MNKDDYKDFAVLMNFLAENIGKKISKERIGMIFGMTQDLDIQEIKNNVKSLLKNRVYSTFPVIAEIRGATGKINDDKAQRAFIAFQQAVIDFGYYDSVKFQDPVIHDVVKALGGWRQVAEEMPGDFDSLQWYEKEFLRLYNVLSQRNKHPVYLAGSHELENKLENQTECGEPIKIIEIGLHGEKTAVLSLEDVNNQVVKELTENIGKEV